MERDDDENVKVVIHQAYSKRIREERKKVGRESEANQEEIKIIEI